MPAAACTMLSSCCASPFPSGDSQTPMLLLSGVFFPVEQMPAPLQTVAAVLPLSHAIDIARPLLAGRVPAALALHIAVLLAYAAVTYYVAVALTRRRLLK